MADIDIDDFDTVNWPPNFDLLDEDQSNLFMEKLFSKPFELVEEEKPPITLPIVKNNLNSNLLAPSPPQIMNEMSNFPVPSVVTNVKNDLPLVNSNRKEQPNVDVNSFIKSQKKQNTVKCTKRDISNVQRWLWENKREARLIENIPPHQLDSYLAELYISIRTVNGKEYELISLADLKNSIERHSKDKQYQIYIKICGIESL